MTRLCASLAGLLSFAIVTCDALSTLSMSATAAKNILFDTPVSNNGARCRIILYKVR